LKTLDSARLGTLGEIRKRVRTPYRWRAGLGTQELADLNEKNQDDLAWLLEAIKGFNCSDPRDKVYAISGMCRSAASTTVSVDHQASVSAEYINATQAIIEREKSLRVLLEVDDDAVERESSWVPDFGTKSSRPPFPRAFIPGGSEGGYPTAKEPPQFCFALPDRPPHLRTTAHIWTSVCELQDHEPETLEPAPPGAIGDSYVAHCTTPPEYWSLRVWERSYELQQYLQDTSEEPYHGSAREENDEIHRFCGCRHSCFSCGNGCYGIGPPRLQSGDETVSFPGTRDIFAIRPLAADDLASSCNICGAESGHSEIRNVVAGKLVGPVLTEAAACKASGGAYCPGSVRKVGTFEKRAFERVSFENSWVESHLPTSVLTSTRSGVGGDVSHARPCERVPRAPGN
jgi:hypothetical protein